MASPASLGSRALRASCRRIPAVTLQRRGLAAAASGSFQYQTGDASGVKYASRDLPGPTTTLTVVAKAGTRYQPLPGYSDALEKFAFKVGLSLFLHLALCSRSTVNHQTVLPTDYQRDGAARWPTVCLPLSREPRPSSQISTRRSTIFHRAPRGGHHENKIHMSVHISLSMYFG